MFWKKKKNNDEVLLFGYRYFLQENGDAIGNVELNGSLKKETKSILMEKIADINNIIKKELNERYKDL